MPKRRINWEIIRQDYIQGYEKNGKLCYPSMRDLAEKYGIDVAVIGRRAKKEEWVAKREIYINKKSVRSQQKAIEKYSEEASEFDLKCFIGARSILEATESTIEALSKKEEPLNEKELRKLRVITEVRLNAQKEAKIAIGEPVEKEKIDITIKLPEDIDEDKL